VKESVEFNLMPYIRHSMGMGPDEILSGKKISIRANVDILYEIREKRDRYLAEHNLEPTHLILGPEELMRFKLGLGIIKDCNPEIMFHEIVEYEGLSVVMSDMAGISFGFSQDKWANLYVRASK